MPVTSWVDRSALFISNKPDKQFHKLYCMLSNINAIKVNLSWKAHIHEISIKKKVSSGIGALKRVKPFVSMHTAIKIYKGVIKPHFDY